MEDVLLTVSSNLITASSVPVRLKEESITSASAKVNDRAGLITFLAL
jgi:hypothetical protein